ncbi:ribosomal protein S11 [Wolbachia endosymbiont of Armadillidium vulgare str. wVulC]|uniref:Small ribosomal subunit protein uS11 n=1 Tax=Wolbachia endosymbiont of Armadillidium arcangelii TaxID=3158571 RepID=A0AAU7Q3S0_9RICK|nr:30S ribosomal protein S11 [Wolbachia endosymbiont of Armadillidium vulgare]KLT23220.1 ribosomal protein S11 [Wolbachia endosymbiont of Armadillidium vulgare str. wVulC]OJH30376.1 30S ribosomal protein S11 [Armadillidium vulgare] [Wolbachia endosymbiont of Armadillidium vulgare]OJH30805.1 30S ribosomal protein S11 [Wolbachia endosymbiont of Armadillidium vulgare]OJH31860.1 30S ribosomal protein S11 [Wolbachia endosymbiont of Armadillidium vulgare]
MKKVKTFSKNIKAFINGVVHIRATFNNTFVNVTDVYGNTLYQTSVGACGFSGSRKSTPYAAGKVADFAAKKVIDGFGMKVVSVIIRGPGFGAEAAVKALRSCGLTVTSIADETPIPHNGCRLRKKRRV